MRSGVFYRSFHRIAWSGRTRGEHHDGTRRSQRDRYYAVIYEGLTRICMNCSARHARSSRSVSHRTSCMPSTLPAE